MAQGPGRFIRDNVFLVAAVLLPLLVVSFFLLATAVPRWLVPPPAYDLVLRVLGPYDGARPRVDVKFAVRDGHVEATVEPVQASVYSPIPVLFLFDHRTSSVREIPVRLPDTLDPGERARVVRIDPVPGRIVVARTSAPDGYVLRTGGYSDSGLIGDLFGMHRHDQRLSLVHRGRVVTITLPPPYQDRSAVSAIGWIVDEGTP